jgi:hypothetical protein
LGKPDAIARLKSMRLHLIPENDPSTKDIVSGCALAQGTGSRKESSWLDGIALDDALEC